MTRGRDKFGNKVSGFVRICLRPKSFVYIVLAVLAVTVYFALTIPVVNTKIAGNFKGSGVIQNNGFKILIVAYKRTGSTFLGRLLGARDDTFYWHEPLRFLRRNYYYRGEDLLCDYYKPSCTIQSAGDTLTRRDYLRIIEEIYSCDFSSVSSDEDLHLNAVLNERSIVWHSYRKCLKDKDFRECLPKLEKSCLATKHRVIKVVRTDVFGILPLYVSVPRLKILQLFRDVRGTVNSRIRTPWYATSFLQTPSQVEDDVKVLCSLIRHNLPVAVEVQEKYITKFKVLQYEDFANLDETLCKLLTWLDMDCTDKHMKQSLTVFERPENITDNKASSDGNHPDLYRTRLEWDTVQMIDKHCGDLHKQLGFRTFKSVEELRDFAIDSRLSKTLPFAI